MVEVALALGVAAFCLIPLFGLLPIGINTNRAGFEQTGAVNVASEVVADLRSTVLLTPPASPNQSPSPVYGIPMPALLPATTVLFVKQDGYDFRQPRPRRGLHAVAPITGSPYIFPRR